MVSHILPKDTLVFEKALKFYIFTRQIEVQRLPQNLKDVFGHLRNTAYSLIRTFLENGRFEIAYLDFINEKLKELMKVETGELTRLQIPPSMIDELELHPKLRLNFWDEEENAAYELRYNTETGEAVFTRK